MKIDHIGYAVKRMGSAIASFEKLGFSFVPVLDDMDRNIQITFGENDGYRIELVCPLNKSKESPIDAYLSKIGPTPYHICYQTEHLNAEIETLKQQGFRVVMAPAEAVAFGGKQVIFMMNLAIGLVEIVEV